MSKLRHKIILLVVCLISIIAVEARSENFGTWIEFEFRKDFTKNLSFSISPELRFQDQFNLDEYFVQGKLSYDVLSFLSVAGIYRIGTEIKKEREPELQSYSFRCKGISGCRKV